MCEQTSHGKHVACLMRGLTMNAPAKIEARPTLADLASDVLADKWDRFPDGDFSVASDREWRLAAQLYLDNLADGYSEPDEMVDLIAQGIAADRHSDLKYRCSFLSGWAAESFADDYRLHSDFGDYYDFNSDEYRALAAQALAREAV